MARSFGVPKTLVEYIASEFLVHSALNPITNTYRCAPGFTRHRVTSGAQFVFHTVYYGEVKSRADRLSVLLVGEPMQKHNQFDVCYLSFTLSLTKPESVTGTIRAEIPIHGLISLLANPQSQTKAGEDRSSDS